MTESLIQVLTGKWKELLRRVERLEAVESGTFVPLTTPATSTSWDGDLYDVDNDDVTIDLSAAFGIPAGVKAIFAEIDGTCVTAGKLQGIGPNATYWYCLAERVQVSNLFNGQRGIVPCDANGDVYYHTDAVHGAEFSCHIRIWGYFI